MPVVRNDVFKRTDDPLAIGLNLVMGQKTSWPITFDAGYSKIERTDQNLETYSGISYRGTPFTTADTMRVQLKPGEIPVITPTKNYADGSILRLTDPQGWGPSTLPGGGMEGYLKYFKAKDEMGQFRLLTKHEVDWSFLKNLEFGVTYTDRYKRDGEGPSGFINSASSAQTQAMPPQIGTTDMSFLGLGKIYAYDPLAAFNAGVWGFTPNNDSGIVANRYEIEEKVLQPYLQFDISGKIGSVPVTGNVGVRAISVDQSSDGYSANGAALNAVSDGDKYTNWAPNLNLNFNFTPKTVLRFGVGRQYARPRMYDLRASRTWGYDPAKANSTDINNSPWSGGGGNSRLKPWEADCIDLSLEHYFKDNHGYFAVAGYLKDLKNYIYEQHSVADFTGYPVSSGPEPKLRQGIVTQPMNGDGGKLNGVEVTLSLASELINPNFKGFGLIATYAYTDSKIKPWGPTA
jgi:iron complex outermembrane receptor protein